MIKDILVDVDGSPGTRERLRYAIGLADHFEACLTGIHVRPPAELPPRYRNSQARSATRQREEDLEESSQAAEQIFKEETAGTKTNRWHVRSGDVAQLVSRAAAFADVVVVGQRDWEGDYIHHPFPIAADIVIKCGRPVLILPSNVGHFRCERITIAWDASREAVRAVHDALPLIALAKEVVIKTIAEHPGLYGTDDLIMHLVHHGIDGRVVTKLTSGSEAKALDRLFQEPDCDALVMGAYGHSKWREFLTGGVTQHALLTARVPILMSH